MGELAERTIFANDTGPLTGTGLDTLAKNQGAILELEGAQAPQSKTITSGSISPTASYVIVDTEGSAAADDLDVIENVLSVSENLHDGMVIYLKAADSGRVVTVKNSTSAKGINTYDGNDYVLSTTHWLKLQLRSGKWYEVEGRAMVVALAAATSAATAATAADHAKTKSGTSSTASGTAAKVVTCSGFELSDQARIFVTFSNANTVADAITLNVNGTGAKSVYNQTGIISTSNTALFAANQPIEFRYDGTGWVFYDVSKVVTDTDNAITGSFKNLKASASGTSVNISVTVDELVVKNSSNVYLTLRNLSLTWTNAGNGVANGIDTGSITANTWYYTFVIYNPTTSTAAMLISLSATAPALPSGYTYFARVGAIRWGTSYPLSFTQSGRWVRPKVASGSNVTALPSAITGVQGSPTTPTWVAASLSSIVPSTAVAVHVVIPAVGGGGAVAPNNSYGGGASTTNPPPIAAMVAGAGASGIIPLETMNIYYAADNANRGAFVAGWEDNL